MCYTEKTQTPGTANEHKIQGTRTTPTWMCRKKNVQLVFVTDAARDEVRNPSTLVLGRTLRHGRTCHV